MKQMEVTILGQSYRLGCPDGGEVALSEAVNSVDREMSAIRDGGKVKARERIAVLAALNLAYALAGRPAERAQSSGVPTNTFESHGDTSIDVDALIRRIDQALGADGQLL